jgi:hypothetical protein
MALGEIKNLARRRGLARHHGTEEPPMTRIYRHPPCLLTVLLGTIVLGSASKPARAQFGWGEGIIGGFNYVPSPTDFLNQHSLINASRGQQAPASFRPYANNPNSFHNRLRDNTFVPSYEVRRRRPSSEGSQRARSLGNTARAEQEQPSTPQPARVVPPLISFFNASLKLVWPSESPVAGELGEKRDISDQASLDVLKETKQYQTASITTVTDARQKLLDYGRPALQEIRLVATTAIADSFHGFMLSLYDSLAQAASPPEAAPGPPPKP